MKFVSTVSDAQRASLEQVHCHGSAHPAQSSAPESQQARVKRALAKFHRLDAGSCQVLYADKNSFGLQPPVPYLWQREGQTLGLPSQAHSRRLSVLSFLSRQGRLHSFATQEKITAPSENLYLHRQFHDLLQAILAPI